MSTVEGKKQEKRRALLDAAYELFLERGTAKTSVEDITSRAKVGKGTFYLYFQAQLLSPPQRRAQHSARQAAHG